MNNNIYLIPSNNSTYKCCICKDKPSDNAILLTSEGVYPVYIMYRRHDLNMCSEIQSVKLSNQKELLKMIDYLGECRNTIICLWGYNLNDASDEVVELFNKCTEIKAELLYQELQDMTNN